MKLGLIECSRDDYYADNIADEPTLSSSIAKLLVTRAPCHARQEHPRLNPNFVRDEEAKFDIGNAAHALMLNDERAFAVIDAKDWRTNAAKDARDAARKAGKIPLLTEQWQRTQAMVAAGRMQLAGHEDASDAFTNGKPEQTIVWAEDGVLCRARLDWLPNTPTGWFDDYKSTEIAEPDAWRRICFNLGMDIQAAFYRRGIRACGLSDDPQFRFVVHEVEEPYALCVIAPKPAAIDLADQKVDAALAVWRQCLKENRWPGYPNRTCWIDVPGYVEAAWADRRARDYDRADGPSKDLLRNAIEMQAPL